MSDLTFSEADLLADAPTVEPLVAGGVRCHGGFDADGRYVSPRTAVRVPAIEAWQAEHRRQTNTDLLDIGLDRWAGHFPNVEQSRFLLDHGVSAPIVSELTRIGTVEGFGGMIRFSDIPDWERCVVEGVEGTATAHLAGGLYEAHARDEAGHEGVAGHEQMWFAVRDIAFENPVTEDQTAEMLERMGLARPGRGDAGVDVEMMARRFAERRLFADLDPRIEALLERMSRLLLIEISAFHVFAWAEDLLADRDRVAGDGEAARLVSYIRTDETPHVEYLKTTLSELRERTFRAESGRTIPGAEVVGRIWDRAVDESLSIRRIEGLDLALAEIRHALAGRSDAADVEAEMLSMGTIAPDPEGRWVEVRDDDVD